MPRPRGHPPLDEHDASIAICVHVPAKQFDAVYALAQR